MTITKVKYTINFKIKSFMVQNKTQIVSNTHRFKKILKKILTWKSNHTFKLMYQKLSHVTSLIKKLSYEENWVLNTQHNDHNDHLAAWIFCHSVIKTENLHVALRWFFANIPNAIFWSLGGYFSQQKQYL